jgi:ABC-type Mn2+/Zn2+ transport system permease subunit
LLFGSILGVTAEDVRLLAVATVIVVVTLVAFHRALLALTFNRDKAASLGMRPGLTHALLMVLVALAVVASFQAVGTLMVFGLIVAPPATASLFARRVPTVMVGGVLTGWVAAVGGLVISYHFNTAAGASIAGLSVVLFFIALAARELAASIGRRSNGTGPNTHPTHAPGRIHAGHHH